MKYLDSISHYYNDMPFSNEKKEGLRYSYDNEEYMSSDAIFLFGMLRLLKPKK